MELNHLLVDTYMMVPGGVQFVNDRHEHRMHTYVAGGYQSRIALKLMYVIQKYRERYTCSTSTMARLHVAVQTYVQEIYSL